MLWIDISRGLLIFLVIIGHLPIADGLYKFIFAFHMYAFFFVSGLTMKVRDEDRFSVFLKNNAVRLLIPYLFYATLWYVTYFCMNYLQGKTVIDSVQSFGKNLFDLVTCGGITNANAIIGPAWFLMALFVVRIVYFLLKKTVKNMPAIGLICLVLFAGGYWLNGISILPFKLIPAMSCLIFVYLGELFIKAVRSDAITSLSGTAWYRVLCGVVGAGCLALVYVFSCLEDRNVNLISNEFPQNPLVAFAGALFGCVGVCLLALVVEKAPFLNKTIAFYGFISLLIMGVHSEIRVVFQSAIGRFGIDGVLRNVLVFVITILLVIPIYFLFARFIPLLSGCKKREKPDA